MSINMRALTPETYSALQTLCEQRGWIPVFGYMEPEAVAWLAFLLAEVTDDGETFPRGKWATIQCLQAMVTASARAAVKDSP